MNSLNETYTSITIINIHIRFLLISSSRVSETYQILTISKACSTLFSMLTMPFISFVSNTLIINIEVFVVSFITRNRFDSTLIITGYGDQILRFNITCTTVQPCCINTHSQLVISLILTPNAKVINKLICKVLITFIHQVFFTIFLNEY